MQRRMWQTLNGGCGHFIHVLVVYRYLEYYLIVRAHMHKDALSLYTVGAFISIATHFLDFVIKRSNISRWDD